MKDFISEFGLTFKQTCLLFSLERQIVLDDIMNSKVNNKYEDASKKQQWLYLWEVHINDFLNHLENVSETAVDITKIDCEKLLENIEKESYSTVSGIKAWRYLILLECTLFTPYYSFVTSKIEKLSFIDKIKSIFNGLSLDEACQKLRLGKIAELLCVKSSYVEIFKKRYQESIRSLSGFWTKVLLAGGVGMIIAVTVVLLFINPIAAAFAAPGLYGAAAFSAGMAALGGGAIAAGGFGIAGGIAVLVGGALVLGGTTGAGITALASSTPQIVLTELAKIEVVLKEIIIGIQKDTKMLQEVILQLNKNLNEMQSELVKLKFENEKNKEKIKNLEEAIEYMKKAMNEFTKMK